MPGLRLAVVLALAAALVAAGPAPAAEPPAGDAVAQAAAKKKKCKKGKVRLKERGRKVRCVAARKVLPAPRRFDVAKSATRFLLGTDLSKVRDRRGRKPPSLPKLLDTVDPRADKALAAAAAAAMRQLPQRELLAAAPCGQGSGTVSGTFNAGGGLSVEMRSTLGPDASMTLGLESRNGARRVRFEVDFPSCSSANLESCPTAQGIVRGRDDKRIAMRASVLEGDRVLVSQGVRLEGETTFRGIVGDDAKLKRIEVHNTEVATLSLGGEERGFDISIRTLVQRITTVTMPSGDFNLGASIVNANVTGTGISEGERRAAQTQIEGGMRREADKQFRDIVKSAVDRFKVTEEAWQRPNACASITFTPASDTKRLRRGETGSVTARTNAKPGGSPAAASWTRTASANAPFTPDTASANPARFSHGGVTRTGRGVNVSVTLKSVSKAGVAQATWTQPTRADGITRISGTFDGTWRTPDGKSTMTFLGDVAYERAGPATGSGAAGVFMLKSGGYNLTLSGLDVSTTSGCRMTGSGHIPFLVGQTSLIVDDGGPPYTYSWDAITAQPPAPAGSILGRRTNCPPGSEGFNNTTFQINLFSPLRATGQISADGVAYTGTTADAVMTIHWSFTGTG
ncbi:MAG: hypothetical protein ABW081_02960 [Solirubrobacteraceae bacterium]